MFAKGVFQEVIAWQYKRFLDLHAPLVFGLKDPRDLESYESGFKVSDGRGPKGLFIRTASISEHA
jgi:hypothetical protein